MDHSIFISVFLSGPLIESITCHFSNRAECNDWYEKISNNIRASRQSAVLPNKLSVQPIPPPHVSYTTTPPYVGLTEWIRDLLAKNQLTFKQIKSLQKPLRVVSQLGSGNKRMHKVECLIYPSNNELSKMSDNPSDNRSKPVVLKDPKSISTDSNPFGYIHYIPSENSELSENLIVENDDMITLVLPSDTVDSNNNANEEVISYNDEDMTFLLPRSLLKSSSIDVSISRSVSRNDTVLSQLGVSHETDDSSIPGHYDPKRYGPWGKRFPSDQFSATQLPNDPKFRVASEGCLDQRCCQPSSDSELKLSQSISVPAINKSVKNKLSKQVFKKEESPPNWISCFSSPKPRRKTSKLPEDVYAKSPTPIRRVNKPRDSPIKFIDKTPSEHSLNLPYCPPVKAEFSTRFILCVLKRKC